MKFFLSNLRKNPNPRWWAGFKKHEQGRNLFPQPASGFPASLLRCEIGMADVPLSVPTLLLVRWTKKQNLESNGYLSGLQFLF